MWSILWKCTNLVLGLEYVKVGKESKEEAPCALRGRLVSQEGLAWAPAGFVSRGPLFWIKNSPVPLQKTLYIASPRARKGLGLANPSRDVLTMAKRREGHWVWSIVRATGSGLIRGARFFSSGSFCAYIIYLFSFYINLHNQGRS